MFTLLAHAGEEHTDLAASTTHWLQEWYVAVPLFVLGVAMIAYLTWLVSNRNRHTTLGVVTFALLIIGFTSFNWSAPVSIIAILTGIAFSLFAAITSVINP